MERKAIVENLARKIYENIYDLVTLEDQAKIREDMDNLLTDIGFFGLLRTAEAILPGEKEFLPLTHGGHCMLVVAPSKIENLRQAVNNAKKPK